MECKNIRSILTVNKEICRQAVLSLEECSSWVLCKYIMKKMFNKNERILNTYYTKLLERYQ